MEVSISLRYRLSELVDPKKVSEDHQPRIEYVQSSLTVVNVSKSTGIHTPVGIPSGESVASQR